MNLPREELMHTKTHNPHKQGLKNKYTYAISIGIGICFLLAVIAGTFLFVNKNIQLIRSPTSGWKTLATANYQLQYPPDWKVDNNGNGCSVIKPNITVDKIELIYWIILCENGSGDIIQEAENIANLPNFQVVIGSASMTVHGISAVQQTIKESSGIYSLETFLQTKKSNFIMFAYSSSTNTLKSYLGTYNKILQSVKFL